MIWRDWLEKWNMSKLIIDPRIFNVRLEFHDADKDAAWEMYIELLTRTVLTFESVAKDGDEKILLESTFPLFTIMRAIMKNHGRDCFQFTKLASGVLNQVIRPFTFKWHRLSSVGAFSDPVQCQEFREDFSNLQADLRRFSGMLAEIAGVEENLALVE